MTKITTEDCKAFLENRFPNSNSWKRVRKFKNDAGEVSREFSHAGLDSIILVERVGRLEVDNVLSNTKFVSKTSSNGYLFCVLDSEEGIMVITTPEDFWNINKCVSDQEDEIPGQLMPAEWEPEDVNGCGTWMIMTDESKKQITKTLLSLGFKEDKEFSKFVKSGGE